MKLFKLEQLKNQQNIIYFYRQNIFDRIKKFLNI